MKRIGTGLVAVAALAMVPALAWAQDAQKDAQNKLLAKRAAEADAYRKLAECIRGLQITSNTYVKDFVTESDTIQTSMDTFIRGARFGQARWESDGVCVIDAEVTVAKLVEELKAVHSRHYKGNVLKATDFESIKTYYKKDIIKVTGMGAPRPDTPPDVPGEVITETTKAPDPFIPEIWKAIGGQNRLRAKRAAEVDAQRKLVERVVGLRITSDTLVRDFVAESDRIASETSAMLVGARPIKEFYHDNELICEVTYEVPVETVITTIKSLHKRHYKGDRVTGMDIEKITKDIKTQTFEATGMGVPPPESIRVVETKLKIDYPEWVTQTITAEGNGVPPEDKAGTPQGKLLAARAAELDAKRHLAEQVWGFQIDSSTKVKDFVTESDEIRTQLDSFIQGSYVKSTRYSEDGTATVVVEMPAMQVWEVVHEYIRIKKVTRG